MNDYAKIVLGALVGSIIPALCFVWFLSARMSSYDLEIKNLKENNSELKQKFEQVTEINIISGKITSIETQLSIQWNMLSDTKSTLDKRETIISSSKEDIKDLQVRLRLVESLTEWMRRISNQISNQWNPNTQ